MEIRQLKYFATLVEETTYTQAAEKLHLTQPSLTASMKKLEKELNFALIDKRYREFRLTNEGQILYHEAKKLLNHFDHVSHEMTRLKEVGPPNLSIGLIESSMFFIPAVLENFKEEQPDVRVSLMETLSLSDVTKALSNFEIHMAITNQFIQNEQIQTIPIYNERLVALIPPGHKLESLEKIHITDLEGQDFIVCKEGFQTRKDVVDAFHRKGVYLNIRFEIERFETGCSLVESGLGITVIPENYVRFSNKSLQTMIKPFHDPSIARTVYLAYDKNRYLPPVVKRFITLVKEFF
ncbi:LysR family transcriptional regulator [Virgibacillus siamensis]|uniref:LysR family transcriptional regulator n=1 Tax=Virgibacillus siamensis TaxID=480071 RepID=UPI0009874D7F|nr:LysR family transcriptional regulator [Virgibacillus siamensis]